MRAAFAKLVIWTKFEVLAVLNPGFHPSLIAAALQDMDDITVWLLDKRERIFAQQRLVDPPRIFVLRPATIPFNSIAQFASNFGAVTSVIPGTRAGSVVVTYNAPESSYLAAGCKVNIATFGNVMFTSGAGEKDKILNANAPPLSTATVDARIEAAKPYRGLTHAALMGLQDQQGKVDVFTNAEPANQGVEDIQEDPEPQPVAADPDLYNN